MTKVSMSVSNKKMFSSFFNKKEKRNFAEEGLNALQVLSEDIKALKAEAQANPMNELINGINAANEKRAAMSLKDKCKESAQLGVETGIFVGVAGSIAAAMITPVVKLTSKLTDKLIDKVFEREYGELFTGIKEQGEVEINDLEIKYTPKGGQKKNNRP